MGVKSEDRADQQISQLVPIQRSGFFSIEKRTYSTIIKSWSTILLEIYNVSHSKRKVVNKLFYLILYQVHCK